MESVEGFCIDKDSGRPKGTVETDKGVVHYTCNPPSDEVLKRLNILPIGEVFGVGSNEVLLIPTKLFEQKGRKIDTIETESLLRDIGKKNT